MNFIARLHINGFHIPSFKNCKHTNKHGHVYTETRVKKIMEQLESGILSELYSEFQMVEPETASECWKRLRTALSGLSDDSLKEIPNASFSTEVVPKGQEGVMIEIYEICRNLDP